MVQYYNSGFITFRDRKIGIVFSGESAEHIMDNYLHSRDSHPIRHIRIQQLAKRVEVWKKESTNRYLGVVTDNQMGKRYAIITEIHPKFAIIITCYKF
jgi:hypothetical protein